MGDFKSCMPMPAYACGFLQVIVSDVYVVPRDVRRSTLAGAGSGSDSGIFVPHEDLGGSSVLRSGLPGLRVTSLVHTSSRSVANVDLQQVRVDSNGCMDWPWLKAFMHRDSLNGQARKRRGALGHP